MMVSAQARVDAVAAAGKAAELGEGYVFISYAHADIGYVQRLVDYLTERRVTVWWDAEIPNGERWRTLLEAKLAGAAAVILVESPDAQDSRWVGTEIQYAQKLNKPVLILLIEGEVRQGLHDRQHEPAVGGALPGEHFLDQVRRLLTHAIPVQPRPILPAEVWDYPGPPKDVVARPVEVDKIVAALTRAGGTDTVGLTGIQGGGGLGKTIVAQMVTSRADVRAAFRGGLLWVNLGQDRRGPSLAALIGELCVRVGGEHPGPVGPDEAGKALLGLLADRPATLVILDDVWWPDQLKPFQQGDPDPARFLVTTRNAALLDDAGTTISVDTLDEKQARLVLLRDVPPLPEETVRRLLKATGGWALVVNTANAQLRNAIRQGSDPAGYAAFLAGSLEGEGLAGLDARDPEFFSAMMAPSLAMIPELSRRRAAELAVFAEDTDIELDLVALLWARTGNMSRPESRHLVWELKDLNLVTELRPETGVARLHDLVRGYLAGQAGEVGMRAAHGALLDAVAEHHGLDGDPGAGRAWWQLPASAGYLWDHLVEHLLGAGRGDRARALLTDLRWTEARLLGAGGAAALDADLAQLTDPTVGALRQALLREAHLLGDVSPSHSYADILAARLGTSAALADPVDRFRQTLPIGVARMRPGWPLPDAPDRAARRVLTGHTRGVTAVAIAPDGTWLATASGDQSVRLWDVATGRERATLSGHTGWVEGIAIARDGSWLVSVSSDRTARLWDLATGRERAVFENMPLQMTGVAIAPDGTWIVVSHRWGATLVDATTGDDRAFITHPVSLGGSEITDVAIAPDGTWLATASWDETVRLWDTPAPPTAGRRRWPFGRRPVAEPAVVRTERAVLSGHSGYVYGVAISPDGTWVASAGDARDGTVRLWDAATGVERAVLVGHDGRVNGVAIAPDGNWLASAGDDSTVRIWNAATGDVRAVLTGHTGNVAAVVIAPDGSWLATGGSDDTVRLWDTPTQPEPATETDQAGNFNQVVMSPDGTWLATGGEDKAVRYWDAITGRLQVTLTGHTSRVTGVAISPRGDRVVSVGGGYDEPIRLWYAPAEHRSKDSGYVRGGIGGRTVALTAVGNGSDPTWIATRNEVGTVRLWSWGAGERAVLDRAGEKRPSPDPTRVGSLAVAPDRTWVATCGNESVVRLWDTTTGLDRATLNGHGDIVNSVDIAPDGTWLATASQDHTVRLWDAASAAELATFSGLTGWMSRVAISPSGKVLATASADGTVRIWATATGVNLATMRVAGWLTSVCWGRDEEAVFVVGQYGPYRLNVHIN